MAAILKVTCRMLVKDYSNVMILLFLYAKADWGCSQKLRMLKFKMLYWKTYVWP